MLKKKHRLSHTKDIKQAFARGRSFFNPLFSVKLVKNASPTPRFTVVVSTKVSKKAVQRNRIKRVLREVLRLAVGTIQVGDYVIIVKPAAANKDNALLRQQLEGLLKKENLVP